MDFQWIVIVGRVGQAPEMRYTPAGVPVTNFTVATTRRFSNGDGEAQERTTWFRVTCWRKLAEVVAQYLEKGQEVLITGTVETNSWTDKEGSARSTLELTAREVRFGAKSGGAAKGPAPEEVAEDELL
ncbi:MAG TPA: single-stranded DNA-binding protein [Anaerolineae bacterium]